jgi:hypothetical protein
LLSEAAGLPPGRAKLAHSRAPSTRRQQQAECCFRPTLDAKSVALAEARRQTGLEVHDALL